MLMNKVGQVLLIHKPEMGFQQLIVMVDCDLRLDSHLFCRGFMFYLCYLYSSTYTGVQHDFYIRCCSCRLSVTQRLSHVVQELLTLPEHTSSLPDCNGVRVARSWTDNAMVKILKIPNG
jgi:hypothetical protein